ncbi:uncharacterized protein LOC144353207 [Saccoglossus kowalevskii]
MVRKDVEAYHRRQHMRSLKVQYRTGKVHSEQLKREIGYINRVKRYRQRELAQEEAKYLDKLIKLFQKQCEISIERHERKQTGSIVFENNSSLYKLQDGLRSKESMERKKAMIAAQMKRPTTAPPSHSNGGFSNGTLPPQKPKIAWIEGAWREVAPPKVTSRGVRGVKSAPISRNVTALTNTVSKHSDTDPGVNVIKKPSSAKVLVQTVNCDGKTEKIRRPTTAFQSRTPSSNPLSVNRPKSTPPALTNGCEGRRTEKLPSTSSSSSSKELDIPGARRISCPNHISTSNTSKIRHRPHIASTTIQYEHIQAKMLQRMLYSTPCQDRKTKLLYARVQSAPVRRSSTPAQSSHDRRASTPI